MCLCVGGQEALGALFEEHGPIVKIKFLPVKARPPRGGVRRLGQCRCRRGVCGGGCAGGRGRGPYGPRPADSESGGPRSGAEERAGARSLRGAWSWRRGPAVCARPDSENLTGLREFSSGTSS